MQERSKRKRITGIGLALLVVVSWSVLNDPDVMSQPQTEALKETTTLYNPDTLAPVYSRVETAAGTGGSRPTSPRRGATTTGSRWSLPHLPGVGGSTNLRFVLQRHSGE